jgi:hypothetical protein
VSRVGAHIGRQAIRAAPAWVNVTYVPLSCSQSQPRSPALYSAGSESGRSVVNLMVPFERPAGAEVALEF